MKTLIYFFITASISGVLALGGNLSGKTADMIGLNLAAFGLWGLFLWHCNGVMKKKQQRRERESMMNMFLRQRFRH